MICDWLRPAWAAGAGGGAIDCYGWLGRYFRASSPHFAEEQGDDDDVDT